jgi:hypothetical protein
MDKNLEGHGHARYDKRGKALPRSLRYTRSQRATEEQVMRIALAFSDHERALEGASGKLLARRARSCERMLLDHYQYYQVQNHVHMLVPVKTRLLCR